MKRRRINTFSLSFLDCMCCGFGAVILMFMIISNRITTQASEITQVNRIQVLRLGAQLDAQEELLSDKEKDLSDARVLGEIIESLGMDESQTFERIGEQATKDKLKANTEEAITRGAFGAPTFFVGEQMFFGNDRFDFIREAMRA